MIKRLLAVAMFLAWAARAEATEWWWIGLDSNPANMVYVDRSLIQPIHDGRMEAYVLQLFDKPLSTGATRQIAWYWIDCRNRHYERGGGIGRDEEGHRFEFTDDAPTTGTIPRNTLAYNVYGLACGQPTDSEQRIDDPFAHAGAYFHREYAVAQDGQAPPGAAAEGPPEGSAGRAPGNGNAGAPGDSGQLAPADQSSMSFGTAFFVGPEGYALTAYHVVDGADRLACRTIDGTTHEAVVTRMNQANDLALLRVDFRPTRYLGLAPRGSLRAGERVFTIGYGAPSYLGINEPRFTEGVVSALSGLQANDAEVQITVPIQPGNSGGPLVNEAGQLVGIITATAAEDTFQQEVGATPQSINWAVKADYAAPLLPPHPPARPMTRAQAISLTHDSVCFVMAIQNGDSGPGAGPVPQRRGE